MIALQIFLVLLCLAGCFYCAGSEIALLSVDKSFLASGSQKGLKGAKAAQSLVGSMSLTLSLVLLGTNAFNSATSALVTSLIFTLHDSCPFLEEWGVSASLLTTIIATPLMLIFGEVIPKAIGMNNPQKFSLAVAPSMLLLRRICNPLLKLLDFVTGLLSKPFGAGKQGLSVSRDEVEAMTMMGREDGMLNEEEYRLIRRTLELARQNVSSVMTPLVEVRGYSSHTRLGDFLDTAMGAEEFSFPVFDGRPDNVVGVITKELALRHYLANGSDTSITLENCMFRDIVFVPEKVGMETAMTNMRRDWVPLVFAVDEYGGVTGIMSVVDVAEEIVGRINSWGSPKYAFAKREDGTIECDARIDAERIGEALNVSLDRKGYDTIGGLVLKIASRIPKEGETFRHGKIQLTVVSRTPRRIVRLRVRRVD